MRRRRRKLLLLLLLLLALCWDLRKASIRQRGHPEAARRSGTGVGKGRGEAEGSVCEACSGRRGLVHVLSRRKWLGLRGYVDGGRDAMALRR